MVFGPWMNNENETDYTSSSAVITLSGAAQNTQWKLVSTDVSKKTIKVASKDGKYNTNFPNLLYYFIIERHSALITKVIGGEAGLKTFYLIFKVLNFTASCIILMSINILSILIENSLSERISMLTINILLHFQVIHQIAWMVPHDGDTSPKTSKIFNMESRNLPF